MKMKFKNNDQKTSFDKNQIRVIKNYLVITVLYKI